MNRVLLGLALLLTACGSKSGPSGATDAGTTAEMCPRNGTVLADLRDVERAGEGLVSTTFGDAPTRQPQWDRAATVLTILKTVWGRSKAACPGFPAARVTEIDQAIATLSAAIPAKDQEKAAMAANAVGLAVPDLFAYFNGDAPEEIVRMDAVFRQVGLDAHFNHPSAAATDVASLQTDWDTSKAAVSARVPTCHRVAGTATVASDIEQSLMNLHAALQANKTATQEQESDNGALEIDTLELLFDCPPDNVTPEHGLGAKCTSDMQCDSGQVCDLKNAGGKCAPSPSTAKIGIKCTSTIDCGTDGRAACNTEAGDGFPGGYCFMEPCDDIHVCAPGGTCVALAHESPGCFQSCTADSDCRTAEGYVCQLFVTTPPKGFGPSDHACAFPCKQDGDCQTPLTCDVASGKCKP